MSIIRLKAWAARGHVLLGKGFPCYLLSFFSASRARPTLVFHRQEWEPAGTGTKGLWGAPLAQGALLGTAEQHRSPSSFRHCPNLWLPWGGDGQPPALPKEERLSHSGCCRLPGESELHPAATGVVCVCCEASITSEHQAAKHRFDHKLTKGSFVTPDRPENLFVLSLRSWARKFCLPVCIILFLHKKFSIKNIFKSLLKDNLNLQKYFWHL